jgi:hypothetical protein
VLLMLSALFLVGLAAFLVLTSEPARRWMHARRMRRHRGPGW